MRRLALLLPALLATTLLAACGADDEQAASPPPADSTHLSVEVTRAAPDPIKMELRCGGAKPCEQLDELEAVLLEPEDPARRARSNTEGRRRRTSRGRSTAAPSTPR